MNNENYVIKYFDNLLSLQLIYLKDSYYIYLGNQNMEMNNLSLSIPMNEEKKENSTINIIDEDDLTSSYSTMLSNSLSLKVKKPIFLSMNIDSENLLLNPEFISFLEKEISQILLKAI